LFYADSARFSITMIHDSILFHRAIQDNRLAYGARDSESATTHGDWWLTGVAIPWPNRFSWSVSGTGNDS
jgi:hypothetical protein